MQLKENLPNTWDIWLCYLLTVFRLFNIGIDHRLWNKIGLGSNHSFDKISWVTFISTCKMGKMTPF